MRTGTVSYKLEDLKKGVIIPIGFVGENDFTKVFFDAEEIYKKYPSASVSMKVQPPKGVIYPAAVTRDGNTVIWQVKESDVANRGGGELQLTFTDGETKIKTYIAKTDVKRSLEGNGPAPDPVQDFVDNANEKLEEVDDALANLAAMDNIAKNAQESDIGKSLSPKTVVDGVVTEWQYTEPSGGTDDYTNLDNKPQIAGVTLSGNKTLEDLGIASEESLGELSGEVTNVKTAIHGVEDVVYTGEKNLLNVLTIYDKTNEAVTNNGDGTYTFGTSDYGSVFWKSVEDVPAGKYKMTGSPEGFTVVATTKSYNTNIVAKNETGNDIEFTNPTKQTLYFCIRTNVSPAESFVFSPAIKDKVTEFENIEKEIELTNDDVGVINEGIQNYSEIALYTQADGWRLNTLDGLCHAESGYSLKKYQVVAGRRLKIVSDDLFQFQDSASVPGSIPSHRVGDKTYGVGTFELTVPDTATYLIVSTKTENSAAIPYHIISNIDNSVKETEQINKLALNGINPVAVLYGCGINTGSKKIEGNNNYNVAVYPAQSGYYHITTTGSRNRAADSDTVPSAGDTVNNYNLTDENGGLIYCYRSYICVEYSASVAPPIVTAINKWKREPSCFDTPIANIKNEVSKNISNVGKDGETFVFITDSHVNTNNGTAPRVIETILADVPVHTVIHGGDVMDDGAKATEIDHANVFVKAFDFIREGFLWCLGNHDENKNGHEGQSSYWLTKPEVYRTFYAKSEKDLHDFDYCYYYYDIPATKTRFIIVDIAYGSISSTKKTWITDLLDESTGMNVIICGHFMREEDGTYTSDASWLCGLTASYSCIKAIIHGHAHYDMDDRTANGVCVIGVDRDGYSRLSEYNKYTASTADETQTAFDIMTVDYLTGDVYCQRLGRGKNRIERAGVVSISGSETLTSALSGTLTWESSDASVATVSGGVVTAVGSGSAMITAYDSGRNSEVWKISVS